MRRGRKQTIIESTPKRIFPKDTPSMSLVGGVQITEFDFLGWIHN